MNMLRAVVIGIWLLGAAAPAAQAQSLFDRSENVTVRDRPRPEYDAFGIPVGGFTLLPKLTLGAGYDDNILSTQLAPLDDAVFTIAPQVTLQSNWNQNALSFTAGSTLGRYADNSSQDTDQYTFAGAGRLDVFHDLTVDLRASQSHLLLPRTSDAYEVFSVKPLLYDRTEAQVDMVKEFSRLRVSAGAQYDHNSYDEGLGVFVTPRSVSERPFSESFRDRDTYRADVRADYALSPEFALFVEETYTHNNYARVGFRNQDSTETFVGPNFEISHLVTAEIGLGYLTSSFADPRAKSVGTIDARGRVSYLATPLITLTLTGQRGVFDSGIPTSPAYLSTTADLQADYELLRNLIISAETQGTWNDYQVVNRHDVYFTGKLSATYLANRGLSVILAFDHTQRAASGGPPAALNNGFLAGLSRSFDDNIVTLSLTLQR